MSHPHFDIGQHLAIGFGGRELNESNLRQLDAVRPGGIVLFARNIAPRDELRALCAGLHARWKHRPIIALDQEGGHVNRLREIVGETPLIAEWKRRGSVDQVREFGLETARTLLDLGIDLNLAPVFDLDLSDAKTENALRDRCWGRTADEVVEWAGAYLRGLQEGGVAGCPKHFPGLGAARLDSHEELPVIDRAAERLLAEDVRPYSELLKEISAVMVGHACYPAWNDGRKDRPATLSPSIVTGLLRNQMGYSGLVLTDDMEMGAIARCGSFAQAVVGAFLAGADLILVCHRPEMILAAHEALARAVEKGEIAAARLAESRERIARFWEEWGRTAAG